MRRSSVIVVCGLAMSIGQFAAGQAGSAPAPAQPAPTDPAQKQETPKPATDGYPAFVQKKLWAKNDLRGKKAPALQAEEWLSKEPNVANKTVLIDLWATWCPPCRELIPELEAYQEKFKDDLVVIGLTSETAKEVKNLYSLRGAEVKYAMARDGQGRLNMEVGADGIPHVLVISSDGIVRWQGFPQSKEDRLTEKVLKQIIDADKAARTKRGAKDEKPKDASPAQDKKPDEKKPEGKK